MSQLQFKLRSPQKAKVYQDKLKGLVRKQEYTNVVAFYTLRDNFGTQIHEETK